MTFIPHAAHPGIPSARGGWWFKPRNPRPPRRFPDGSWNLPARESFWLVQAMPLTEYFEGCYLTAYPDPCSPMAQALVSAGLWYDVLDGMAIPSQYQSLDGTPWTDGWGQTGPDVHQGTVWTQHYADARLGGTSLKTGQFVQSCITVPVTQSQIAACEDFTYNEGDSAFKSSTLLRLLNEGDYDGAAAEFPKWNLAGGQVNSWLVKRRACEQQLFLTGTWTPPE